MIGEIPYTTSGQLYSVLNNPKCLKDIQQARAFSLKGNKLCKHLFPEVERIKNEISLDIHQQNLNIQDNLLYYVELLNQFNSKTLFKPSFYYSHIVSFDSRPISNFHLRLRQEIMFDTFQNKYNFQVFMKKALIIYHQEIQPISNIAKKNKSFWMGTGFENITDVFDTYS